MAIDRTNQPDTPEAKLRIREALAREHGKAFDENLERRVMGLPEVMNPVVLAESERRKTQTKREVAEAVKETADAAKPTESDEVAALKARIAELEAQNAPAPVVAPEENQGESGLANGTPDETWTAKMLMDHSKVIGLALPRGGVGMTKMALLDAVLEFLTAPEPEAVLV